MLCTIYKYYLVSIRKPSVLEQYLQSLSGPHPDEFRVFAIQTSDFNLLARFSSFRGAVLPWVMILP
jgi:hypothetical protein